MEYIFKVKDYSEVDYPRISHENKESQLLIVLDVFDLIDNIEYDAALFVREDYLYNGKEDVWLAGEPFSGTWGYSMSNSSGKCCHKIRHIKKTDIPLIVETLNSLKRNKKEEKHKITVKELNII
jgi:hypothetical protein